MARRLAFMCLLMLMIMLLFPLALGESGNLKRDGTYRWNWMPAWVKVSKNNVRRKEMLLEFRYGVSLPNHKWCGFNNCGRVSSGSTNATDFAIGDVYGCLPPKM